MEIPNDISPKILYVNTIKKYCRWCWKPFFIKRFSRCTQHELYTVYLEKKMLEIAECAKTNKQNANIGSTEVVSAIRQCCAASKSKYTLYIFN